MDGLADSGITEIRKLNGKLAVPQIEKVSVGACQETNRWIGLTQVLLKPKRQGRKLL
jgi:hypothetical protein